ncbi:MAG: redoxin domain-containing protein [Gemmataceae bacterium]
MPRLLALLALPLLTSSTFAADSPAPVGRRVADFTLPDPAGKPWSLAEQARTAKGTVVVFLATGCPVSNAYLSRLADYHKRFAKEGVVFVGVNSHPADDTAAVAEHAKVNTIPFPVLKDADGAVAARFAVERVPTAVVLDAGRTVRYAGRIDDQFSPGVHRAKATTRELFAAIDAVVDGREVTTTAAPAAGCKLARPATAAAGEPVTYHKQVSRILQAKCQHCHRPGEPAPFSLLDFKNAKGWAGMIREVVADGVMPPWHADAPRGHFVNDRRLTDAEKATLLAWVDQGCAEGDPADAPPPRTFVTGWRLGRTPDRVLTMTKPVNVPAQYLWGVAGMPYQYVPVGEAFAEDTWVQAVEVRPDYRAAIHHIIAFVIPPGQSMYDIAGPQFARHMLAAYVPGDDPVVYPEGTAKLVKKGSKILFEVHYTPMGKPGVDRSAIGLVFAKSPPKWACESDALANDRFAIPPGAASHEVTAERRFRKPVTLVALTPHMHLRGKSFRYELVSPDGTRETLLNVPRYDFNWQVQYVLAKPVTIPAGGNLVCTAVYDNSAGNPFNPDPAKKVHWGEQTWEEMMIGFIEYLEPGPGKETP